MVGIVIDDALVVLENTFRFLEEKKMPPLEAARAATSDIGHTVLADLCSGFLHVQHRRQILVSVRNYGCGGSHGELAGFVHAYANDVLSHATRVRYGGPL